MNNKSNVRFEPYPVAMSRNPPSMLSNSRKTSVVSSIKSEPVAKKRAEPSRFNIVTSKPALNTYDMISYANGSRLYQQNTNQKIIKPKRAENKKVLKNADDNSMRVLTTKLKNISQYHMKLKPLHSHLFEVIAQLDSVVSDNGKGTRLFSVKDENERIHCVFNEIDRKLPKLVRNSFIRCVGRFNASKRALICVSVRAANQDELFNYAMYCQATENYILNKFP